MQADHGMARMQELLSSYYGMQDAESEAERQRDIDAPGFSPSLYVRELLQSVGLAELLQRDDRLIREIKELDTNMQMLVYENYNKFISATDTIRKMKANVASMEHEVAQVVASMDVITARSESINVALAPHRSTVEKLIGVRRLLKRLEFIFELPQRLRTAVKQEELATATKSYLLARRILERYDHITSFKAIQVEAAQIVRHLEGVLHRRLVNNTLPSEQVCEAIHLLAQLGSCTDEMKQQFLDWHHTYFVDLLASFKTGHEEKKEEAAVSGSVFVCLHALNRDVLAQMTHVFAVYRDNFLPDLATSSSDKRSSMAFQDEVFAAFAKEIFAEYLDVCAKQFARPHTEFGSLSEIQAHLADTGDLLECEPGMFAGAEKEYFVLMWVLKHFVTQVNDVDAIVPPCRLARGASAIVESCVRYQIALVFRELRLETVTVLQKAHQLVLANARHNSGRTVSGRGGSSTVSDPSTPSPSTGGALFGSAHYQAPSVQLMAQDMGSTLAEMIKQVLRQMNPLLRSGATILSDMSKVFSDLVQMQFYHFLKWFNASMVMYTEPKRAFEISSNQIPRSGERLLGAGSEISNDVALPWLEPTPPFLLYLACICRELSSEGISECLQELIDCLPAESNSTSSTSTRDGAIAQDNRKAVEVTQMIQITRETSEEIALHIAKTYGHQLSMVVRRAVAGAGVTWMSTSDEPRSVQGMAVTVIEMTQRFGREVAVALGEEQSPFFSGNGTSSRSGSRDFRRRTGALPSRSAAEASAATMSGDSAAGTLRPGTHGSAMHLDVARIFAKRTHVYESRAELSTEWFVLAMLKMVVKAYSEWVREFELTTFALQQVQLNAEFWRSTALQLTPDNDELDSLLSDLLSNARERAMQDVLMEQNCVVAVVSAKSSQVLSARKL